MAIPKTSNRWSRAATSSSAPAPVRRLSAWSPAAPTRRIAAKWPRPAPVADRPRRTSRGSPACRRAGARGHGARTGHAAGRRSAAGSVHDAAAHDAARGARDRRREARGRRRRAREPVGDDGLQARHVQLEPGLRPRPVRRVHGRGRRQGRQRLHGADRAAGSRPEDHDRGRPRQGPGRRGPAPDSARLLAGGRLPVRHLHARLHHVDLRAAGDQQEPDRRPDRRRRWPATSAAAASTRRSSRRSRPPRPRCAASRSPGPPPLVMRRRAQAGRARRHGRRCDRHQSKQFEFVTPLPTIEEFDEARRSAQGAHGHPRGRAAASAPSPSTWDTTLDETDVRRILAEVGHPVQP